MTNYQAVVPGLREWAARNDSDVRAAVELLIEHGHWVRNDKFTTLCVVWALDGSVAYLDWHVAESLLNRGKLIGTGSELAVLKFAVMIALDTLGLASLDNANRDLVVLALSDALVVTL